MYSDRKMRDDRVQDCPYHNAKSGSKGFTTLYLRRSNISQIDVDTGNGTERRTLQSYQYPRSLAYIVEFVCSVLNKGDFTMLSTFLQ